ncbi:glutaredoxin-C1 [Sesbania bispinosa]|nr:glutaredoxin-C1 [Sesbania bispinosa]
MSKRNHALSSGAMELLHEGSSVAWGVNTTVHELDQDPKGKEMEESIDEAAWKLKLQFLLCHWRQASGSMDRVLASTSMVHLFPLLKKLELYGFEEF